MGAVEVEQATEALSISTPAGIRTTGLVAILVETFRLRGLRQTE